MPHTGNVIRDYRLRRDMSQTELAEQLGASQTAISRIEHGRPLLLEEAARLCDLLRIPRSKLWAAAGAP